MKRVGVIGTGVMGSEHAARWQQLPVELVGYHDHRVERAERLAQELGGRAFTSMHDLIAEVDIVDVCTPTPEHRGPVIAAAEAGKHIVCEKPLARHLRDAEAMIAACETAGVRLFVAQVVRFFPEFARAKEIVDSGAVGRIGVVRSVRAGSYPTAREWYGNFDLSGGVILDLAIHDIDYLRWLCGDVERVFAHGLSFERIAAKDHALITLRFKSGAIGHIDANWSLPAGIFNTALEIAGDEGILQVDNQTSSPLQAALHRTAGVEEGGVVVPGSPVALADEPYYGELAHFLQCLESGAPFRVQPQDGLAALRCALAAIESVRTGKPVAIDTFVETT